MPKTTPFDQVRERLGLTYAAFAEVLGLPFSSAYNACKGWCPVPKRARAALVDLGFDPDQIAREQASYMQARAKQRREELRSRLAGV